MVISDMVPTSTTIRILIVDDNPADVEFVRYAFSQMPSWVIETLVVDDGEKAMHYLQRIGAYQHAPLPHLILLDLNLPKYSGVDVLRFIRQSQDLRDLPVIVLSSSPHDVSRERLGEGKLEADGYLTKPPDLDEFIALGPRIRDFFQAAVHAREAH